MEGGGEGSGLEEEGRWRHCPRTLPPHIGSSVSKSFQFLALMLSSSTASQQYTLPVACREGRREGRHRMRGRVVV